MGWDWLAVQGACASSSRGLLRPCRCRWPGHSYSTFRHCVRIDCYHFAWPDGHPRSLGHDAVMECVSAVIDHVRMVVIDTNEDD